MASTIGALLKREGLVRPRRRRPAPGHPGRPTTIAEAPNALWTADFKGQFKLGTGSYCYPLTIIDGFSRYLLACRGLTSTETTGARGVFEGLFRTYGLPDRIRTDNGPPFATCALGRLSALSVWWIKLGIRPELIQPATPNRTAAMNGSTARSRPRRPVPRLPPRAASSGASIISGRSTTPSGRPAQHYAASPRRFPAHLPTLDYPQHFETRYVSTNGGIRWHKHWVNLVEEWVGLEDVADGVWSVYFGPLLLGRLDERDYRLHGQHNRNRLPR